MQIDSGTRTTCASLKAWLRVTGDAVRAADAVTPFSHDAMHGGCTLITPCHTSHDTGLQPREILWLELTVAAAQGLCCQTPVSSVQLDLNGMGTLTPSVCVLRAMQRSRSPSTYDAHATFEHSHFTIPRISRTAVLRGCRGGCSTAGCPVLARCRI